MALESTQPLTEISASNSHGGKRGRRRVTLTTSPSSPSPLSTICGSLNVSQSSASPRPVTGTYTYIQDVNYSQNFNLFIQNSFPLNQYIAGIDLKVFENSHCTPFV
jgi:hypothetical protein